MSRSARAILCLMFLASSAASAEPPKTVAEAKRRTWKAIDLGAFGDSIHHYGMSGREGYQRCEPDQIVRIAENLLLWQCKSGGWPKNEDFLRVLSAKDKHAIRTRRRRATFDNRSTWSQVGYLARVYEQTRLDRCRVAARRGLEFILNRQHDSGGWRGSDVNAIAFNDDVMTGVLHTLLDVTGGASCYEWVGDERRERCGKALARGVECVLACQVRRDGELCVWAQQHDHETFKPIKARSFELPGLVSAESVGVTRFLMRLAEVRGAEADPRVLKAVHAAARWFEDAAIEGIRVKTVPAKRVKFRYHLSEHDRVVVEDPDAPPVWTRFYDLKTNRSFFATRKGEKVYSLAEVSRERRTGYAWYGRWPARLLSEEYPAWCERMEPSED